MLSVQAIRDAAAPRPGWGPAKPVNRTGRYAGQSHKTSLGQQNMAPRRSTEGQLTLSADILQRQVYGTALRETLVPIDTYMTQTF